MNSILLSSLGHSVLRSSLILGLLASQSCVVAAETTVSWWRDVTPVFKRSCNGCHNPNKLKGEVDTSTFAGLMKHGKHGANLIAGDPAKSLLITSIAGKEPDMPKEGDALSAQEVSLITRWIQEGAKDDTPADAYSTRLKEPPTYTQPPVISTLDVSPDGARLAVAGYHEVLLIDTAGRMQGNENLMRALAKLVHVNNPDVVLFVGEALVGNDAIDQLTKFNQSLIDYAVQDSNPRAIDGIILTKFDTVDEKVGTALNMVYTTGKPIVFVGVGQKYPHLKKLNV